MDDDDEIKRQIGNLTVRSIAIRDVVARLLAHVALKSDDPGSILREFSGAIDTRVDRFPKDQMTDDIMNLLEGTRKEVDWIIDAARVMMRPSSE
jgi:hypothetical protein